MWELHVRKVLNHGRCWDAWPPEKKSIQGQRQGWITQSFCVIKFHLSIKEIEKASDIDIRRGQKEYPLASVSNGVIYFLISCDPMDTRLLRPWDFLGKSTGVGCNFLLQGIFPTQGSNPGLPHCRQTLYHLSHRGSSVQWIKRMSRSCKDITRHAPTIYIF